MPPVNRLTDLQVRESPSACVLSALAVRLRIAELCATSEIRMEHDISAVFHGDVRCHALLYLCLRHCASHTIINVIAISTTSRTMPCSYGETSPSFFPILPPLLLVTAPIEDSPSFGGIVALFIFRRALRSIRTLASASRASYEPCSCGRFKTPSLLQGAYNPPLRTVPDRYKE